MPALINQTDDTLERGTIGETAEADKTRVDVVGEQGVAAASGGAQTYW